MGGFEQQSKDQCLLPEREFVQAAHFRSPPLKGPPERAVVTSARAAALMWSGRVGQASRMQAKSVSGGTSPALGGGKARARRFWPLSEVFLLEGSCGKWSGDFKSF
jgi:hypothetical protein